MTLYDKLTEQPLQINQVVVNDHTLKLEAGNGHSITIELRNGDLMVCGYKKGWRTFTEILTRPQAVL